MPNWGQGQWTYYNQGCTSGGVSASTRDTSNGNWDGGNPNDKYTAAMVKCSSDPNCRGVDLWGSPTNSFNIEIGTIYGTCNKNLDQYAQNGIYVKNYSGILPVKYKTLPQPILVGSAGGHYCQNDHWPGTSDLVEVENSNGNRFCTPLFPTPNQCPSDLGTPLTAQAATNTGGLLLGSPSYGIGHLNIRAICGYDTVPETVVWNQGKMGQYFQGSDTTGTIQQIKSDVCGTKDFNYLFQPNNNCIQFYNAQSNQRGQSGKTERSNAELLARIVQQNHDNWPDDANMRNTILDIVLDNGPSASSALAMITNYCSPTSPWPDNNNMRTFINELIDPLNPTRTNPTLAAAAVGFASAYCRQNPTSPHCGCWNAAELKQYSGCSVDANKDLPGCGGLYDLHNTFKSALAASPSLASVITPIENAIKPVCFAAECKACAGSSSDVNLRTGSIQTCNDTINICLQNVTVKGDMKGTLNQACNINLDANTPANSGGIPTSLQTTTNAAGQATVNASSGPAAATTGPVSTASRTVDGQTVDISSLPIKPGQSAFVDKYLPTPQKQYAGIGGFIFCILCCCLLLLFSGGGDSGAMDPMALQMMMLR